MNKTKKLHVNWRMAEQLGKWTEEQMYIMKNKQLRTT